MTSSFHASPGSLRIQLTGDLIGGAEAIQFSTELRDKLSQDKSNKAEIDASGVGFVNSSGLGMLISARQAALEHGAEFRISGAGEQLRHLLEVTKLTEILGAA
jgi:anti-sigma B factor antagonist